MAAEKLAEELGSGTSLEKIAQDYLGAGGGAGYGFGPDHLCWLPITASCLPGV